MQMVGMEQVRIYQHLSQTMASTPVVLGQVMSYNDHRFSAFWSYDCNAGGNPPKNKNVCVGKHIGETTSTEDLGYIVIEGDPSDGSVFTSSGGMIPIILLLENTIVLH